MRACVLPFVREFVRSFLLSFVRAFIKVRCSVDKNSAAMNRLQTTLARTRRSDAGLVREAREVREDVNTDVDRYG